MYVHTWFPENITLIYNDNIDEDDDKMYKKFRIFLAKI